MFRILPPSCLILSLILAIFSQLVLILGNLSSTWPTLSPSWGHLALVSGLSGGPGPFKNCYFPYVFACFGHLAFLRSTSAILNYLGPSGPHLDPSWGHLGAVLEPSWGHLGAILGPLGPVLGPSWGLTPIGPRLGKQVRGPLAASPGLSGPLGASWGHLGA